MPRESKPKDLRRADADGYARGLKYGVELCVQTFAQQSLWRRLVMAVRGELF